MLHNMPMRGPPKFGPSYTKRDYQEVNAGERPLGTAASSEDMRGDRRLPDQTGSHSLPLPRPVPPPSGEGERESLELQPGADAEGAGLDDAAQAAFLGGGIEAGDVGFVIIS